MTALACVIPPSIVSALPLVVELPDLQQNLNLGEAYSSLTGTMASNRRCVDKIAAAPDPTPSPLPSGAAQLPQSGSVNLTADIYKTASELREALGFSVAASYGFALKKVEASASFTKQRAVSAYTEALVVDLNAAFPRENTGARFLDESSGPFWNRHRQDWQAIYNDEDSAAKGRFLRDCGDYYVGAVQKGGRLRVVFTADTTYDSELRDIKAALSGNYGAFAGNIAGQSTVASNVMTSHASFQILQQGPTSLEGLFTDPAQTKDVQTLLDNHSKDLAPATSKQEIQTLFAYIEAFTRRLTPQNAVTLNYELRSYETLGGATRKNDENDPFLELVRAFDKERDVNASLAYAVGHLSDFAIIDDSVPKGQLDRSNKRLELLRDALTSACSGIGGCAVPEAAKPAAGTVDVPPFTDPLKFEGIAIPRAESRASLLMPPGNDVFVALRGAFTRPDPYGRREAADSTGEGVRVWCTNGERPEDFPYPGGPFHGLVSAAYIKPRPLSRLVVEAWAESSAWAEPGNPPRFAVFHAMYPDQLAPIAVKCDNYR